MYSLLYCVLHCHVSYSTLDDQPTNNRVLAFCKTYEINALRIPISLDLALDPLAVPSSCAECPAGKTSFDMLDVLFTKAANAGILILLDMHRLDKVINLLLYAVN
jgi:hypothetical protein